MPRTRVRVAAASLALAAVVISVGLSSGRSTEPTDAGDIGARLCELSRTARTDPSAAGAAFMADIHGPLHEVAASLTERDRPAAGRLLVAKSAVEQALEPDQPDRAELARSLSALADQLPDASPCEDA